MKALIAATLLVLGFSFAHADEMVNLPVQTQDTVMSSLTEDMGMEVQGHHTGKYNYCCIQSHGGGYCTLNYYDKYGAACKCYVGNQAEYGHVCN
ncbi:MAG: hypothetical protein J7501_10580 [Bdellovibrio sp.]|nr:hypothetical protein [Bdellovibrio sp.]